MALEISTYLRVCLTRRSPLLTGQERDTGDGAGGLVSSPPEGRGLDQLPHRPWRRNEGPGAWNSPELLGLQMRNEFSVSEDNAACLE